MEILRDGQLGHAPLPEVSASTSPGLRAGDPAFELKFELGKADVLRMIAWARRHLSPDPHGEDGRYQVTSVYCDTPEFDVYHRSPGYRSSKLRLRRYGTSPFVFLERKIKKGDRVRKRRVDVAAPDLERLAACMDGTTPPLGWPAAWFVDYALKKRVAPVCRVRYIRRAFYAVVEGQAVRLTIDEELIGGPAAGWDAPPLDDGVDLLPDGALLELKFHGAMPELYRRLLPELPAQTARVSKYRRCARLRGLVPQER